MDDSPVRRLVNQCKSNGPSRLPFLVFFVLGLCALFEVVCVGDSLLPPSLRVSLSVGRWI